MPQSFSLDPAFADGPVASSVAGACYEPLTRLPAGATAPQPALAASVDASEDQRSFTFRLRAGATFADGRAVTADDAVRSLARVRDPALASPLAPLLGPVDQIRAEGADRVVVTTNAPFRELPVALAHPGLGIADARLSNDELRDRCNGSGPYRSARDAAGRTVLVRRAPSGDAPERVTLVAAGDPPAAQEAFAHERVDVAFVSAHEPAAGPGYQPYTAISFVELNPTLAPLSDPRLREAVVRALDASAITRAAYGEGAQVLQALVPPAVVGAGAMRCRAACTTDPDAARRIVGEAFAGGAPALTFDYDEGEIPGRIAAEVVRELGAVGIAVTAVAHAPDEYAELLARGSAPMFRFGWVGEYGGVGAFMHPLFSSAGEANLIGPIVGVDTALDAAQSSPDPAVAASKFADAADAVLDGWLVKPLAAILTRWRTREGVTGLVVDPLGAIDLTALRTK